MSKAGIPDKSWRPPFVVLETSMGEIMIELYWNEAPKTCRNFAELARRGYYDNTIFHRIIPDLMVQGGDPTGTGRGGTSIYGKTFEREVSDSLKHTGAGIISMANAGPDTNEVSSQFFLTLGPAAHLNGKHTIIGRVYDGITVLSKMGKVATDNNDCPREAVSLLKAYVRME